MAIAMKPCLECLVLIQSRYQLSESFITWGKPRSNQIQMCVKTHHLQLFCYTYQDAVARMFESGEN